MGLLTQLIEMSNRYGSDARFVLAGGGNTSFKQDGVLHVKASGTKLATIGGDGFVKMDIGKLEAMLQKQYPADDAAREDAALADMTAAMLPGQQGMRPSVECILHALFPYSYVLHVHPALVNGMTCGKGGAQACGELFPEAVWVPLTKPGYVLGKTCGELFGAYAEANGSAPKIVFMQNHGIIAAANSVDELDDIMRHVMDTLDRQVKVEPDFSEMEAPAKAQEFAPAVRALYANAMGSGIAAFCTNKQVDELVANREAAGPMMLPFTPDQIVYCKGRPLYITSLDGIEQAFLSFRDENGYAPKIVLVEQVGFFALGKNKKEADIARELFLDSIQIAVYARSFGGPLSLTEEFTNFILNWEAENYRQGVALGGGVSKRMEGKVCVITGGAQGFGEGIARGIAAQGGYTVIADLNKEGARKLAGELDEAYGPGTAVGVVANVADEQSVAGMIEAAVLAYGGVDVMVSCAGILIAGGLDDMTADAFEKVTKVNYTGYFLCAKYASVPMKAQRRYSPGYTADIVEINSKSGLEGSKANFAYAGSKFGGIGLTQSFALELAPHGVKVNAICPGNLLDGPLWSDPEKGLFRQYLDAGKVAGAKTIDDVRRFYEGKVPMGRGCHVEDVVLALYYVVEQQYETGQAVPVTGGQVMLR